MNIRSPLSRYVSIVLVNVMFWHPVVVFAEGISVAPNAGNTSLDKAGNGVPVVNIATPNGRGLSHNTFKDYNVGKQGAILNNATKKLQSTQLGGIIVGNPNLREQAAKLIINEVNGGQPSQLKGYTEVAGSAANVVVANPYGITCDGCGFINSPRVTLSTGRPIIEDGDLERFAVDRGRVTIEGLGLDATQVDQFDIITRAAKLNADLHANHLNIVTGANDVDADTLSTSKRQGQGAAPSLAIDASALGGMYAGSIKLVGTEGGVGVRLAGDMAASRGDIQIDVDGHLSMAKASSRGRTVVQADSATLNGNVHAGKDIALNADERLAIQRDLTSATDVVLEAGRAIVNDGRVIAGIDNGTRRDGAELTLRAERIDNRGRLDATERLSTASSEASNSGQLLAQEIAVTANRRVINSGTVQGDTVRLAAETLSNQGEAAMLAATSSLDLTITNLDNLGGTLQFAEQQDVRLDLLRLDNTGGMFLLDGGNLRGGVGNLVNRRGRLAANSIDIDAGSLTNGEDGLIAATVGDLALDVADTLDNTSGQLQAEGGVTINAGNIVNSQGAISGRTVALESTRDVVNRDGVISAEAGDLSLQAGALLDNARGSLQSRNGGLTLAADVIDNRGGALLAAQTLGVAATGRLDNGAEGVMSADTMQVMAGSLGNRNGKLVADNLTLSLGSFDNDQGLVSAENALTIHLNDELSNRAGRLQVVEGNLSVLGGTTLDNTAGTLVADHLNLQNIDAIVNDQGRLIADAIDIDAGSLTNGDDGLIASGEGGSRLTLERDLDNRGGKLQSERVIDIAAQRVDNGAGTVLGTGLLLSAQQLINRSGVLLSGAAGIALSLADAYQTSLDNRDGIIDAQGGTLTVDAHRGVLDNGAGSINGQRLELKTGTLLNGAGQLVAGSQGMSLDAQQIDNRNGLLIAEEGGIAASFGILKNQAGTIQAAEASLSGDTLYNGQQGLIASLDGRVTMVLANGLDNRSGQVIANGTLDIDPPFIDNRQGQLAGRDIRLEAGRLDNAGGIIEASESLNVAADTLNNVDGELRALGGSGESRIDVAQSFDNRTGRLDIATRQLWLRAKDFINTQGQLNHAGAGLFSLFADTLSNQNGQVQGTASGQATLQRIVGLGRWLFNGPLAIDLAQGLTVQGGERIASADTLNLDLASLDNTGDLLANGALSLHTAGDITNRGLISTQGDFDVRARHLYQRDGRLASGGDSRYRLTGNLDNLGRLTGIGDVDIQASTLNNRGTLGSQGNLRLVSRASIDNRPDTLLFSGGDMTLRGARLFNRYGDIYSRGYLDFALNDQHAKANSLENRSGVIEANDELRFYVKDFKNVKDKYERVYQGFDNYIEIKSKLVLGYDVEHGTQQCGHLGVSSSCKIRNPSKDRRVITGAVVSENGYYEALVDSPSSVISSGGNIRIQGGVVENNNSAVSAGQDLLVYADSLRNSGDSFDGVSRERIFEFSDDPSYNFSSDVDAWNQEDGLDGYGNPLALPSDLSNNSLKSDVSTYSGGGNISRSVLQAGNKVFLNVSNNIENGTVRNNARTQLSGKLGNTATGGPVNSLTVTLNRRTDDAEARRARSHETASRISTPVSESLEPVGQEGIATYRDSAFERVAPTQLSSFRLPQGRYGLFVRNSRPQSRYLIETNPEFTSADKLMGSDYLLGKLSYTDDSAYKLLGDGRYESRLVRDAVLANTGQRFLNENLSNDYDQYRYLMDNAVAAKDALQLTVGVGLTPEQTAALTHDIVWMEEQKVDGETVLAPVLYLAQVDSRNVRGNSLIQGRDIELIAGGDLTNVGTIRASDNLSATSGGSILQGGLIEAGQRLEMTAKHSIRNAMAGEIRGGQVSLEALKGDIVNDRTAVTAGYEKSFDTYLDQGGLISARDSLTLSAGRDIRNRAEIASLGDATLTAGRDIANTAVEDAWREARVYGLAQVLGLEKARESTSQLGASITAGGDSTLIAGRDVAITASKVASGGALDITAAQDIRLESNEERSLQATSFRGRAAKTQDITQAGSELSAAEDISLQAGQDVTAIASRVEAGGNMAVEAGRDLTLASAQNIESGEYQTRSAKQVERQVRQQGSEFIAGGDLSLSANDDLRFIASQAEAGYEAYLFAGDDVELLAANDQDYFLYENEKDGGLFGSSRYQRDEISDLRAVGSQLESGGDLTVVSGGDQTYQGARLVSGGDLGLVSLGEVHFEAASDMRTESHEKRSGNFAWQTSEGEGTTDETLRQSVLIAKGNIAIQAANGVIADVPDIDRQTVSQTIDAMVAADPELAWLKDMEARGDVDWRRVKEIHDSWSYEQSGLGAGAALVVAIVVAYFTAGAASGLVASAASTAGASTAAGGAWAAASAGVAAGWANAAATAAIVGAASNAAVSTINNRGDMGEVFDDVTASDALRGYAVAGITAGLTQGVYSDWTSTETGLPTGLENGGRVMPAGGLGSWQGVGQFGATQVLKNGTAAVLDQALGGEGDLGDALQASLANTFSAAGFNAIGDATQGSGTFIDGSLSKAGLHAVMGGLAAEALGGDFKTGAVAAGVNELLVDRLASQYDAMPPGEKGRLLTMNSQLIGVLAAELSGGDAEDLQIGSQVAASATQYNYLRHEQINDYVEELDRCEARGDCTAIEQKYQALSDAQQESLIAVCETDLDACAAQYESVFGDAAAMQAALDRLKGSGREDIPFSASDDAWVLHEQNEAISNRYLFALTKHELEQTTDLSGEDLTRLAMVMTALGGPRRGGGKAVDGHGAGQQSGATTRGVVDVSNVRRGTPEYEALNNPAPNTTTELSNGTTFKTGAGGYVDEVTYRPVDSPGVRGSRQTAVGKEGIAGDVGGHIQACRHGGTCDRFNLFPQNSNFNNSAYKRWENEITRSLQNGDDVGNVTVRLNRTDPYNPRPDSLEVEYQINGRTYTREFENQPGGRREQPN